MNKDNIFFGEVGLTTTSANYICNLAKEAYRLLDRALNNIQFYRSDMSLLSGGTSKILSIGNTLEELSQVEGALMNVAKLKSLIAWLREAIKAKDRLIKEANNLSEEDCAKALDLELPIRPVREDTPDTDDVIATYNIKQRNTIYQLNTLCAEIGQYIHIDGKFSQERLSLQDIIDKPVITQGDGRDMVVYTRTPNVTTDDVDAVYFRLQQKHREYQAQLNALMHEVETKVQEAERNANLKYEHEMSVYTNQMNLLLAKIKAYKDEQIIKAQSLKIIIPDSLKDIYNEVSQMGKKEK